MTACKSFAKVLRAFDGPPQNFHNRLGQLQRALQREIVAGQDHFMEFLGVLEDEIENFERKQFSKPQNPDGPTAQTVRKLRDDPVVVLKRSGTINTDDEVTIEELRRFKRKHDMGLVPGSSGLAEKVDTSTKTFIHPLDRFTNREQRIFDHVWLPWCAEEQRRAVVTGKRRRALNLTRFDLVFRVIENNEGIRKIQRAERIDTGGRDLSDAFVSSIRNFSRLLHRAESARLVPRRGE